MPYYNVYIKDTLCLKLLYVECYFVLFTAYLILENQMDEDFGLDEANQWWYDEERDCCVYDDYDEDYEYEEVK